MARMMPAYCSNAAPPGERDIFDALATSGDANDWIALHSLSIAEHVRQVEGEADFVVIVPDRGVLVIEVKSHRRVEVFEDGSWKLGNDEPTTRGPFQQAKEAMHSLRSFLLRSGVDLRSTPFLYAVWFTSVRARSSLPTSPEWHSWQVLDSQDMEKGATPAILRTIAAGSVHLESKLHHFGSEPFGPSHANANRIASILRPRFESHVVSADVRHMRNSQLVAFLEEQYQALDSMAENKAVLFNGPAGSGKTLLAVEAARREAAQGKSGLLLCFNRLLGRRISLELENEVGVEVATLHQEMLRIADVSAPEPATDIFWNQQLPELATNALLKDGARTTYDFIIVDEVQDIARPQFLDVLDLLLDAGFKGGRLLCFGDFERQAIYGDDDGRPLLKERCPQLVSSRLVANCRNLPRLGFVANTFTKLNPGYKSFRRHDDGVDPDFITYVRGGDQSDLLVKGVRDLRDSGYGLDEIVVLSPQRTRSTAETTSDVWLKQVLRPMNDVVPKRGVLRYSTIHSFKGLESPAVVITDLDSDSVRNFASLLYIGLTRAMDRAVVIIETKTLSELLGGQS